MIPKRLVRTVPEYPSAEQDRMWRIACDIHPDWEHVDRRDPNDAELFPLTAHLWATCDSGSQKSDLIRAEELYHRGGLYLDSDVECFKPFDSLLGVEGFAAYEDPDHICTAVLGFRAGHPALKQLIDGGIERHSQGAWAASIGVASEKWPTRTDMAILPPGCWFPYHYTAKWEDRVPSRDEILKTNPWAYAAHHWDFSWKT